MAACICGARDPGEPVRRGTRTGVVAVEIKKWAELLTYKMEPIH